MPAGRPTILDEQTLALLEASADEHWTVSDACAMLGIVRTTWQNWRNKGEADIATEQLDSLHAQFVVIAARVAGPKRRKEAGKTLREIMNDPNQKAADRVTAAATILRLDQPSKVEVTGAEGGEIKLVVDKWGEQLDARITAAAAKLEEKS